MSESSVVNTYCPAYACHPRASAEFMAVLTQDCNGLFAVYTGLVPKGTACDERARTAAAEWVAFSGNKQRLRDAQKFYPTLTEEMYRA